MAKFRIVKQINPYSEFYYAQEKRCGIWWSLPTVFSDNYKCTFSTESEVEDFINDIIEARKKGSHTIIVKEITG